MLVAALGESPRKTLSERGVLPFACEGLIEDALAAVYDGRDMNRLKGRRGGGRGSACQGTGEGCGA